jgi:Trypsin-like peptidase domain
MIREEREEIEARLREVVFSLNWCDEEGRQAFGTGFFISADGVAVTAYHNLSPELKSCPEATQIGKFKGNEVEFRWLLQEKMDRVWQEKHDVAILQAQPAPEDLKPLRCFFLSTSISQDRGSAWAGDDVVMLGYPASAGSAQNPLTGHVNRISPLRDHNIRRADGTVIHELSNTIQIVPDHPGELTGLRGMSGAPLYDTKWRGIVGMVVGVESGVSGVELWPVVEKWPRGKELLKKLPIPPPAPRLRWPWLLLLFPLIAAAFLWWYWHQRIPKELAVDVLRLDFHRRGKLTGDSQFKEGERVRFLLTSPVPGFLYVVDQELDSNGAPGQPELIFPTTRTGNGRNRVSAGAEIPFPAEDEDPPYLKPKPPDGDQDYGGELLTVLVYADPLKIELKAHPIPLTPDQIPLDGLRPRLFQHESAAAADALAVQQIRVAVRRADR